MSLVFIDVETGGTDPAVHPIIQVAAIATDAKLTEVASFERKILFDEARCEPKALEMNHYDPAEWHREGLNPKRVCEDLAEFLRPHCIVPKISTRTGGEYFVAQLAGYNADKFDGPFIQELFKRTKVFLPANYSVLCVLQKVRWYFWDRPEVKRPKDLQLKTVVEYFGETIDAHEALEDVRATAWLARHLKTLV